MATKGTSWVVKRSTDLVPALLALAVRDWFHYRQGTLNLNALIGSGGNLRHNDGLSLVPLKAGHRSSGCN
jgi:hypothetical protein